MALKENPKQQPLKCISYLLHPVHSRTADNLLGQNFLYACNLIISKHILKSALNFLVGYILGHLFTNLLCPFVWDTIQSTHYVKIALMPCMSYSVVPLRIFLPCNVGSQADVKQAAGHKNFPNHAKSLCVEVVLDLPCIVRNW